MTEKEIKRLNRQDLLVLLAEQKERAEKLEEELLNAEKKLEDRRLLQEKCGSMAEAALKFHDVFRVVDEAAALFTENVHLRQKDCAVYEDINIEVTGGHVDLLYAGNDYSYSDEAKNWEKSYVQGNVTVSIKNGGSATRVFGDVYHTPLTRTIKGAAILEAYCDEKFDYLEYWDVFRIIGDGTPNSATVETRFTTGGSYIGRIEVNNGGRLLLDDNGYINILNEVDQTLIPLNSGSTPYELKHAWQGESSEDRRELSTLAVVGSAITPSGSYLFDRDEGKAGLRIKGNVEGLSTLEAVGEPMYSTGDTYYYYVVADSSDNGGKAFREPEGAPYVVCYRYLQDGRIGWYLRERPVLTMDNSLLRVGTEGTLIPTADGNYSEYPSNYVVLHVDMKCDTKLEGLAVRVMEISSPLTKDAEHANRIKDGCFANCGFAAPKLAQYIIRNGGVDFVLPLYKQRVAELRARFSKGPSMERFVEKFAALFVTTAEIASQALKLPFDIAGLLTFLEEYDREHGAERNTSAASYDLIIQICRSQKHKFYVRHDKSLSRVRISDEVASSPKQECWGRITNMAKEHSDGRLIVQEFEIRKKNLEDLLKSSGYTNKSTCVAAWRSLGVLDAEDATHPCRSRKIDPTAAKGSSEDVYILRAFADDATAAEIRAEKKAEEEKTAKIRKTIPMRNAKLGLEEKEGEHLA